ncbi:MAG: hypothetical protein ACRC33_19115 [Gemmataceae bacterium]
MDKLFEMAARASGDPRFAHFEAQMTKDPELPWRMFRYGRRAGEHFNQPVGRFAVLGDEDPDWKPAEYREGALGCQDLFTFRVAKLSEWRGRTAELESGDNLFGLFLCAHLETMATRADVPGRQEAKYLLLANLMRRGISPDDFRRWYRLIDWIMKLSGEANRAVWLRLQEIKEPRTMSHVTFAEIIGIEKGRTEGLQDALRGLLLSKFPQGGSALVEEFGDEANAERLKALLQAAGLAASLEEFRSRIACSS